MNLALPGLFLGGLAFGLPLGRLRAGAGRFSHRRFGLLAASALLLIALRSAFSLSGFETLALAVGFYLAQVLGRRCAPAGQAVPSPLRWRTAAYATLLASLLLLVGDPAAAQGPGWKRLDADEAAPGFKLTDQNGKAVSLASLRGKVVVASFIYTECKDICPVLPQILARVDKHLQPTEQAQVRFVGISIDPLRDTPQKLRSFMAAHGLSPQRWTLLTGTSAELTQVATDYGIVAKPDASGELVHNGVYILIDGQGKLRTEFHGLFTPTEEIAGAVRALLPTGKTQPRRP
ncbi:MAG: SCO family protein [Rhodoferax sp.]